MNIAFKEWSVVDRALGEGEQTILLRKGGIQERHGRFEVEHDEFLIYPTYLHQKPELLKPAHRPHCRDDRADPAIITIHHSIRVEEVFTAPPMESAARWDRFHVYSPELIVQRYRYKPERPLYALLVRVHRLVSSAAIHETPAYAGCRSWVVLSEDVSSEATPVLAEAVFQKSAEAFRESIVLGK